MYTQNARDKIIRSLSLQRPYIHVIFSRFNTPTGEEGKFRSAYLKTKIISDARVSKYVGMHALKLSCLTHTREEENSTRYFFSYFPNSIAYFFSLFSAARITSTDGGGIENKIPGVWKKNFNFSPAKRDDKERDR